jgi:hypothetical protein
VREERPTNGCDNAQDPVVGQFETDPLPKIPPDWVGDVAHRKELASESESEKPIGNPARVTRSADGLAVVKFDRDMQQRVDIRTEPVLLTTKRQEVVAYGRLEDDPSRSFVLRAPVAGTVRGAADHPWPEVGQTLADRSAIGFVEPRLAPADRITLGDRLAAARAEVASVPSESARKCTVFDLCGPMRHFS